MSIATEIQRINENIANSYIALAEKGAKLPTNKNSDNLVTTITTLHIGEEVDNSLIAGIMAGTATDLNFPDEVTKIRGSLFDYANNRYSNIITSLSGNGITQIDSYSFNRQQNLTTLDLPNLKTIGNSAFQDTIGLKDANLLNLTKLGTYVFNNSGIQEINIPKCTNIGTRAFYKSKLTKVPTLGESCFIDDRAFENSSNLKEADLSNVSELEYGIFKNCTNLLKIWLPSTITRISSSNASYSIVQSTNTNLIIYTDAIEKPSGWDNYFNYYDSSTPLTVIYGASYEDYLNGGEIND